VRYLFYVALILGVAVYGDISMAIFALFGCIGMEVGREEEAFRNRDLIIQRMPLIERRTIRIGRICMKGLRIGRLYLCPSRGTVCIIDRVVGMEMPGIIFGLALWTYFRRSN
tara:strand:- start:322 stop:657 length:336 start_codon:yes stop_codon:yes gene_type:complete